MILRKALLLSAFAAMLASAQHASAALLTFVNKAAYDAQLTASTLIPTNFTNFDSLATGGQGASFSTNGIGFGIGAGAMRILSTATEGGATSSGTNFLGFDDAILTDFTGGDTLTLTLPVGARAIGLKISSPSLLDGSTFGTLASGAASVNSLAANGVVLSGATSEYFLGIVDTVGTLGGTTLSFTGGGLFRVDDVGVAMVPEPSSLALAAAAGLVGFARRRSRRS